MANWNNGYQQPYHYPQPPPPPPPPPARRSNVLPVVLIVAAVLVVVMVISIVVIVAVRASNRDSAAQAPAPVTASSKAPDGIDKCLVGNWRQSRYTATIDFPASMVSNGKPVGPVTFTGFGRQWKIQANGSATERYDEAIYGGKAADGRTVSLTFSGSNEWMLKTSGGRILFEPVGTGNVEMTVEVDSKLAGTQKVEPQNNPVPFKCSSTGWTATSLSDPKASTTYEKDV